MEHDDTLAHISDHLHPLGKSRMLLTTLTARKKSRAVFFYTIEKEGSVGTLKQRGCQIISTV